MNNFFKTSIYYKLYIDSTRGNFSYGPLTSSVITSIYDQKLKIVFRKLRKHEE